MKSLFLAILALVANFSLNATQPAKQARQLDTQTNWALESLVVEGVLARVGSPREMMMSMAIARDRKSQATLTLPQAPAVIETTSVGSVISATFMTTRPLDEGTFVIFRMTLPNGLVIPLQGFSVQTGGYNWYSEFWNGAYPNLFPSGLVMFETIFFNPSNGEMSYVSAQIPVRMSGPGTITGPVDKMSVSNDGMFVDIEGSFEGVSYASMDGQFLPVATMGFSPTTGRSIGKIYLPNDWQVGQKLLTFTSVGVSISRWIYIVKK